MPTVRTRHRNVPAACIVDPTVVTADRYMTRRMDDSVIGESTISQRSTTSRLPPCKICGEKSSGFHYGVLSCEACKGFFRRFKLRKKQFRCNGSESCDIGPGQRNICSFCRYRKCLDLGMSKTACTTGRFPVEKRTKIILEMKTERQSQQTSSESTRSESFPGNSNHTPHDGPTPSELDEMIRTIVEAHDKNIQLFLMPIEEIEEKQKRYLDEYNLRLSLFGSLKTLPKEQYEEIYQTTGIDVDNRQQKMKDISEHMEEWIRRFLVFVKSIPGFSSLSAVDQANLVKSSEFECRFMECFRGYNSELKVFVLSKGKCYHSDEITKACDLEYFHEMYNFSQTLKKLNLHPEEDTILKTICVMFTDRCELQNPGKVEEIQLKLVQCLMHLFQKNHKDEPGLFARVIDRLTAMRELTEMNYKLSSKVKLWPAIQDNPVLVDLLAI